MILYTVQKYIHNNTRTTNMNMYAYTYVYSPPPASHPPSCNTHTHTSTQHRQRHALKSCASGVALEELFKLTATWPTLQKSAATQHADIHHCPNCDKKWKRHTCQRSISCLSVGWNSDDSTSIVSTILERVNGCCLMCSNQTLAIALFIHGISAIT